MEPFGHGKGSSVHELVHTCTHVCVPNTHSYVCLNREMWKVCVAIL